MLSRPDTKVRYRVGVADRREINREAWAALVAALVRSHAEGNQTRFAKLVDVTPKTVSRWLRQEVAVTEENVRVVARKVGEQPLTFLVRVGYYTVAEAQSGAIDASGYPEDDLELEIQLIRESRLPEDVKGELIAEARRMREDQARQRHAFRERLQKLQTWLHPAPGGQST